MIQSRGLAIDVAARRVLSDASFTVGAGDKVGLVGRNGVGKTSLLKVLAGEDDAAAGVVLRRGTLGYVPQNPRPRAESAASALSHILSGKGLDSAATRLGEMHRKLETDHSPAMIERYSEAEERYRHAGGYSAESEARRIAAGLGLRLDRVDLPLGVLSGGERRRVELARVLFAEADLLLLDEPTNHLDTDAKTWLMDFLRDYRGSVIVVSHDLGLLDASITRVLHLDAGRMVEYRGTYSQYQAARRLEERRLSSLAQRQEAEIKRLSLLAEVMRRQTEKRARQAKSVFTRGERRRLPAWARRLARLLRAGARRDPRGRPGARAHARAGPGGGGTGAASPAGDVQPDRRHRAAGRGDAVGRREDQARAGAAGRWAAQPAPPGRADQQPRPAFADGRGAGAGSVAGDDGDRQPRSRVRRGAE